MLPPLSLICEGTWAGGCGRRPEVGGGACSRWCRKGIGSRGDARGPWAGRGPIDGGDTIGTWAGGGVIHIYRDSKKVSLHILGY
jgi:hypothetical protein